MSPTTQYKVTKSSLHISIYLPIRCDQSRRVRLDLQQIRTREGGAFQPAECPLGLPFSHLDRLIVERWRVLRIVEELVQPGNVLLLRSHHPEHLVVPAAQTVELSVHCS